MHEILVTGGCGYIGSHVVEELLSSGYVPIVLDNRHDKFSERMGNMVEVIGSDIQSVYQAFTRHKIKGVIHLAGSIQVGESVVNPALYYMNNVQNTISLVMQAKMAKVDAFVFSSTAAVYGNASSDLINEYSPLMPINPYGRSKLMIEDILRDFDSAYDFRSVCLRYFNAAGAGKSGLFGENHPKPETHLIPSIFEAIDNSRPAFKIFGTDYATRDGTCIRDYVHVSDLARAHVLALEYLLNGGLSDTFNLGSGRGNTVREIVDCVQTVTQKPFTVVEEDRRQGDPDCLVADISKARNILGYDPTHSSLFNIVETAWHWYNNQP